MVVKYSTKSEFEQEFIWLLSGRLHTVLLQRLRPNRMGSKFRIDTWIRSPPSLPLPYLLPATYDQSLHDSINSMHSWIYIQPTTSLFLTSDLISNRNADHMIQYDGCWVSTFGSLLRFLPGVTSGISVSTSLIHSLGPLLLRIRFCCLMYAIISLDLIRHTTDTNSYAYITYVSYISQNGCTKICIIDFLDQLTTRGLSITFIILEFPGTPLSTWLSTSAPINTARTSRTLNALQLTSGPKFPFRTQCKSVSGTKGRDHARAGDNSPP
ncbi:hypothetical protein PILCRDRAFT_278362 [Piloderma croceum F 1598]|uniref:Uncharacterized protein n=1 Tax=Piloderma croceum (strain F 1598) TaxID=765440 RepID=A0A0C3FTB8_PILCF|nr:hypothetical protein PILCRDRAFT_278362 [Piloderma croceum F 1598]